MSQTAEELRREFDEAERKLLGLRYEVKAACALDDVLEVCKKAVARIEQLERGIGRADERAVKCLGGWADMDHAGGFPSYHSTLLSLIETLGEEE